MTEPVGPRPDPPATPTGVSGDDQVPTEPAPPQPAQSRPAPPQPAVSGPTATEPAPSQPAAPESASPESASPGPVPPGPVPPGPGPAQVGGNEPAVQPAPAAQPAQAPATPGQSAGGGGYVLVSPQVPATVSGLSTGGLISGSLSCLLGALSCCWWPLLALPLVMGAAGLLLGYLGMKQVDRSAGEVTGKSVAIWAMVTGGVGVLITLAALLIGLVLRQGLPVGA